MAVSHAPVWQEGEVIAVEPAADGVTRITLRTPTPYAGSPGSHLDVAFEHEGQRMVRSYSIVASSPDGREHTIGVQLAAASRGGSAYMHGLRVGDRIEMTQPLQNFPLGVGAPRYVLVAGGIGVTPIVGMAAALKSRKADYQVVYAGRSRRLMAYVDELVAEHGDAAASPDGRVRLHVTEEGTELDVQRLVDEVASGPPGTELYMCGPIRLMDEIRREWAHRGLPMPLLRFETFGNSGSWEPERFVVRVPKLGREVEVREDDSMLDALERAGVEVMSDCRKGECGLCQVRVLELDGRVDHRDVFFSERQKEASRYVCSCVSRVVAGDAADGQVDRDEDLADEHAAARRSPGVVTVDIP